MMKPLLHAALLPLPTLPRNLLLANPVVLTIAKTTDNPQSDFQDRRLDANHQLAARILAPETLGQPTQIEN